MTHNTYSVPNIYTDKCGVVIVVTGKMYSHFVMQSAAKGSWVCPEVCSLAQTEMSSCSHNKQMAPEFV